MPEPAIPDEPTDLELRAFASCLPLSPLQGGTFMEFVERITAELIQRRAAARLPGPGDTEVEAQRRRADAIKKLYDDQFRRYSWQSARINQLRDEIIRLGGTVPEYSPGVVSTPAAQPANDEAKP